jgi:ABC-type transport system substrate-binding protein
MNHPSTFLITGLVSCFLFVSCETKKSTSDGQEENYQNQTYLRVGLQENIKTLEPGKFSNSSETFIGQQIYEGLFCKKKGKIFPNLVKKIELDTAKKTFSIALFSHKKFSDGSLVTTRDVYASFKALFDQKKPKKSLKTALNTVFGYNSYFLKNSSSNSRDSVPEGFKIINEHTFTLSVNKIDSTLIKALASTDFLIWKKSADQKWLGSGPFKIDYANDDISYNLSRNEHYDIEYNESHIDGISIRFIKNDKALTDEFIHGSLDLFFLSAQSSTDPRIQTILNDKYGYKNWARQSTGLVRYLSFENFENENHIKLIFNELNNILNTDHPILYKSAKTQNWVLADTVRKAVQDSLLYPYKATIPLLGSSLDEGLIKRLQAKLQSVIQLSDTISNNLNLNAPHIVIEENPVTYYNPTSREEQLSILKTTNSHSNAIYIVETKHDLIIFDERISGFTAYGNWINDTKNLVYTKPKVY